MNKQTVLENARKRATERLDALLKLVRLQEEAELTRRDLEAKGLNVLNGNSYTTLHIYQGFEDIFGDDYIEDEFSDIHNIKYTYLGDKLDIKVFQLYIKEA